MIANTVITDDTNSQPTVDLNLFFALPVVTTT
jgi:hypothetical protein